MVVTENIIQAIEEKTFLECIYHEQPGVYDLADALSAEIDVYPRSRVNLKQLQQIKEDVIDRIRYQIGMNPREHINFRKNNGKVSSAEMTYADSSSNVRIRIHPAPRHRNKAKVETI